jgi:hypothetical protein
MPRKMPHGQRPGARRTIPARQAPSANNSSSTERTMTSDRTATTTSFPQTRRGQAQPTPAKGPVDFEKEYHYVFEELRNVGILAGCVLVGLVVLSFIIH